MDGSNEHVQQKLLFSTDFGYLSIDTVHQLKLHQASYLENLGKHSSCCDSRLHNRVYVSNRFNRAQCCPFPSLACHGLIITHFVFTVRRCHDSFEQSAHITRGATTLREDVSCWEMKANYRAPQIGESRPPPLSSPGIISG